SAKPPISFNAKRNRVETSASGGCRNRRRIRDLLAMMSITPPMAMKSERKPSTTRSARYGGFDMAQSSIPWHCTRTQYGNMLVNCGWGEDGTEFSPFASVVAPAEAERCQAGHVALPALPRPGVPFYAHPRSKAPPHATTGGKQ